jgi:hypothetical protein
MRNGLTMADRDVTEMLQRETVQINGPRKLSRLQRETVQIHGVRKLSRRFEAGRQAGSQFLQGRMCPRKVLA